MARSLDQIMAFARLGETTEFLGEGADAAAFAVPSGIAPDSAKAVQALAAFTGSSWLIVDGYNVAFHVDAVQSPTPESRDRVMVGMADLRARAAGELRITVVWDSAEEETVGRSSGGVERVFVADADEEVRQLSAIGRTNVVVVSSDREVQHGVAPGTVVLWSEALVRWMQTR